MKEAFSFQRSHTELTSRIELHVKLNAKHLVPRTSIYYYFLILFSFGA